MKHLFNKLFKSQQKHPLSSGNPYKAISALLQKQSVSGILDAGASSGRVSLRFLQYFPHAEVYAFEANSAYADTLHSLAAEDPRIHPQILALSDREEEVEFNIMRSRGVCSLFKPGSKMKSEYPEETSDLKIEKVKAVTLDSWREQNGNPPIQLMKFDIQGAELKALRGARDTVKETVLLIYTEVFFNPLYDGGTTFSEIDTFLRDLKFSVFNIFKARLSADGSLLQANVVFVSDKLCI